MQTVSRLITQFIPENYQLYLHLNRTERTFNGTVTIRGTSPSSTGQITVHAKALEIGSATIDGKAASVTTDGHDELVIIHPDIKSGRHIVVITFNGEITDTMHGLYPCYYEHDGSKKELLATQFESHHAREVFPCIDEPEAKATFDVTLTTEQGITVLGNMPVARQVIEDDLLVTTFDTTPRMSTYLLVWVAGELHKKTATTNNGIQVNIWATPAQPKEKLEFALEHAVRTIEFFDEYFGTPYPLPKSDHVALPDFTAGAMENWGLITYREIALLTHPTDSSIASRQYVANVITHELSHQWFGNLVTMKWWNDLWLNESFATLMGYVALDVLYPQWNIWLELSNFRNILALRRDSIDGVQSVQMGVNHPDEIGTLFDSAIVYAKGARLLRMLQNFIGEEAFQKGLQSYFDTHAYANTEANDLWRALSDSSGKDITTFMNTWISQPGYPLVAVSVAEDDIQLHQQRFFIGPHAHSESLWPIPLNAEGLPNLFSTRDLAIRADESVLIRLNVGDTAHFITKYATPLLIALVERLSSLSTLDRLQLLHEQTLLARGGEVGTASLIPLLIAYKDEPNEAVWNIMSLALSDLKLLVEGDEPSERSLRSFAAELATSQHQRLGWRPIKNESEADTKLRALIIATMLYGEVEAVISAALDLYHKTPLEQLNPELRPLIIGAAVRHGDDTTVFESLIERYRTTTSADLREDIMSGLSWVRSPKQMRQLLSLLKDSSTVRPQDVVKWFALIIRSRYGREPAWEWLRVNWAWIAATFGSDKSYDYFPRFSANVLRTQEQLEQYQAFFGPMQNEPSLARVIQMGLSEIEGRIMLIERDAASVRDALAKL